MSIRDVSVYRPVRRKTTREVVSRSFDITIAGMALIAFAPVMLLIAAAVYLEGARPIFFVQKRLGINGLPFNMYKFRKFRATCSTSGSPLTVEGDCRLTKIGKILAATKMDELPQLWNVLKGEMAIVGPRPESMAFADCFHDGYEEILNYKPGLVGPSQVLFRHEGRLYPTGEDPSSFYRRILFPAKAEIDLVYFKNHTFGTDLMWMLRSGLAILNVAFPVPSIGLKGKSSLNADRH